MNYKLQLIEISSTLQKDIQDILRNINSQIENINHDYLSDFNYEEVGYIQDYLNKLISDLYV